MVYLVEETSLAEDYKEKLMMPAYHLEMVAQIHRFLYFSFGISFLSCR